MARSLLRRPDHSHPFSAFAANDLAGCEKALAEGFDPAWTDERGMTCAMEAASRGHAPALALALRRAKDPAALARARADSGMDAFDMAAACGSATCMHTLSKHLPPGHESSVGRGLPWHAVEAHPTQPSVAHAWLVDLCMAAGPSDLGALIEASERAREIGWAQGASLLRSARARLSATPLQPEPDPPTP